MSRIDEALKRAGHGGLSDARALPNVLDVRSHVIDATTTLEAYVAEEPRRRTEPALLPPRPPVVRQTVGEPTLVKFNSSLEGKLVVSRGVSPVSVEQYRRLAATLHELQIQRAVKTLMVSSTLPQEGKTLTVTNLALTLAESYRQRVLLLDADFRRPAIHEVFGLPIGRGLADVLGSADRSLPVIEISPRLSVVTAGQPSALGAVAQLASDRLRTVLKEAARFDWILLDTPPVLVPDAQLVARECDGVLFIIAAGSTPYRLVQRGIAEIGADRIIGTLLNRIDVKAMPIQPYYGNSYGQGSPALRRDDVD
jgi:protein-tyrosine kinase